MPTFRYKAMDGVGRIANGRIDAINDVDLELRLKRLGLDLVTARELRGSAGIRGVRVDRKDLISFCFDMEQMTRAGIPLLDGLRDVRDSVESTRFRQVIAALLEDIEGGKMLSQAMEPFPNVFDGVFVSLIRAGEQTGRLTDVFESLWNTLKWQDELASETKKLLIYPIMVFLVVICVMLFLLMYLVPQVVGVLQTMRVQLPLQTRALIAASDFTVHYWWLVLGLPIVGVIGLVATVKSNERAAFAFDRLKLRIPVLGPILQKIILARFASFFALMYQSGITILDAIRASEGIVGNRVVAEGLRRAGQQINAGEPMSETFRGLGMFPPLVIRMLKVGENTGALDRALLNINYFYSRDVKDGVDRALKVMGPALTVVLGGLMGLILFSILTPIYDLIGKLKF